MMSATSRHFVQALRRASMLVPSSSSCCLSTGRAVTTVSSNNPWKFLLQHHEPSSLASSYRQQLYLSTDAKAPSEQEEEVEDEVPIPGVGRWKTSTGIVGLAVDHNWYENLTTKCQALLDRIAESDMPETARYRQVVEKVFRYRLKAAMEHPDDPDKVEELCNCGQVEELIEQADDEMELLEMYLRERMWELVEEYNKNNEFIVDHNPDPMADHDAVDWQQEEAFGERYINQKEVAELRVKKSSSL